MTKELDSGLLSELEGKAADIRCSVVKMISKAQVGHPGGSLSAADILSALYFHILRVDPNNPQWPDRDRLILSKGHGATALYSVLALKGFFDPAELETFATLGSKLQVHPDKTKVPGVEASTGALGQGLSIGAGIAYAAKINQQQYRSYVILGDGEMQEGQIWEAAMFCAQYKLDNLTAILDYNNVQLMGDVPDIIEIGPVADKWTAFRWNVIEIDGHDITQIIRACRDAESEKGRPTIIIAKTIKGRGVDFMEGSCSWHGQAPTAEQCEEAIAKIRNV